MAALRSPVSTLARVAEERRVLLGFGIVALYGALHLVTTVVDILGGVTAGTFGPENFPGLPPEVLEGLSQPGALALIPAVISPFVGWVVVSLLMQLVTRFFGGTGPLSGMFAVVGVAASPLVIVSFIELLLTVLQAVIGSESTVSVILNLLIFLLILAAYACNVVLVVIGAALARRIGYGESAGACAISCTGCAGLILLLGVALGVLIALLTGAVSTAGSP